MNGNNEEVNMAKGEHEFRGALHPEITGYQVPTCKKCGIRIDHPFAKDKCKY